MEEKNCENQNLEINLKCKETELSKINMELDGCTKKCSQLNEMNEKLKSELECTNKKLVDEKSCARILEEKLNMLSDELTIKSKQLSDSELRYENANCKIYENKSKIDNLKIYFNKLKEASEKSYNEMKNHIQKLKIENYKKDDELCCLKNKIKELSQENEFNLKGINAQNKIHNDKECQLKQLKLISEKTNSMNQQQNDCCLNTNTEKQLMNINYTTHPNHSTLDTCCNSTKCSKLVVLKCAKSSNVIKKNSFINELKNVQHQLINLKNDISRILNK